MVIIGMDTLNMYIWVTITACPNKHCLIVHEEIVDFQILYHFQTYNLVYVWWKNENLPMQISDIFDLVKLCIFGLHKVISTLSVWLFTDYRPF